MKSFVVVLFFLLCNFLLFSLPAAFSETREPSSGVTTDTPSPGIIIKRNTESTENKEPVSEPLPFSKDLKNAAKPDETITGGAPSPLSNPKYLLTSFLMLLVVCVLAFFSIKFISKGSGPISLKGKRLIRFVERLVLSPQKSIMIFQVAGRYYLVGVTEQGMNLLAELDNASVDKELENLGQDGNAPSFSQYLSNLGFGSKGGGGKTRDKGTES